MTALDVPVAAVPTATSPTARRRRSRRRAIRPGVALAAVFLVLLVVAALVPEWLAPQDPLALSPDGAFLPPGPGHLLGTDQTGRDVLSRIIHGARPTLILGLGATALAVTGGTLLGLLAGIGGRFVEGTLMRLVDVALAVPDLLLALVVITLVGTGTSNVLFAVAFASVPYYARIVRAQVHVVRRATYVEAATTLGLSRSAVIARHVLPNALKPLVVLATIRIGDAIANGASLSFLGLGTPPPAAEWGSMLSTGIQYISNDWFMLAVPGLAITLTVLAVTVVGRDLRRRSEGRAS
ncbi:ABC transporter permease [Micromonospora sp. NPDC049523]|uniref:ABC transporter permease n=1 Tax=Micromonospora sp. NPDC049523 TaxID=3155921 RepID=UPI00343374B4